MGSTGEGAEEERLLEAGGKKGREAWRAVCREETPGRKGPRSRKGKTGASAR